MSANMSQRIATLKNLIVELEADAQKSDAGNKAAGVRVRKASLDSSRTENE